jgi:hypothetical protein
MSASAGTPVHWASITVADRADHVSSLIRVAGLFAAAAGLIYAGIQPVHPADVLESVTTSGWTVVISFKLAACLFFLIGISGLYFHQASKAGWMGALGFALFALSWWLQASFVFAELFILPPLATVAPEFVSSFLGIVNGHPGTIDVTALASAYGVVGLLYLAGGILLGVGTLRAGVLPRLPSAILAIAALATPAAALLPHAMQRFAAVPVGLAFVWLGLSLWFQLGKRASA